jgi:hypothetical protein
VSRRRRSPLAVAAAAAAAAASAVTAMVAAVPAGADVGSKPKATFAFSFPTSALTIRAGVLLQCEDAQCEAGKPLQPLGPQRFGCDARSCRATAYGFARFQRLEVTLSDGRTLRSEVFENKAFDAEYRVSLDGRKLVVRPAR